MVKIKTDVSFFLQFQFSLIEFDDKLGNFGLSIKATTSRNQVF